MPLDELFKEMEGCTLCSLRGGCSRVVPGEGPEDATIFMVGEAPGEQEDIDGRPFVGRAGTFLRFNLTTAKLEPEKIFITNTARCRPPDNRDPLPGEIDACWPWTEKLLKAIRPKIIVTLGKPALLTMARKLEFTNKTKQLPITKLAGIPIYLEKQRCYVYPILHPAYALRKQDAREQFESQIGYLGIAAPQWLRRG